MTLRALRWAAFLLLAFSATARLLTTLAPNLYFGADPRISPLPFDGLGPAGSMTMDLLTLLGAALAIIAELLAGRRLDWKLLILFALPIPAIVWFAGSSLDDLRIGSSWIAALATAIGAAHLAREPRWRVLLIATIMAMAAPLAVKAAYQVFIEHPATVEHFEQNRDTILTANGWSPDSAQARLYIRRLEQNEATAWIGLSNVFGTLMATFAVFWIGATITTARSRLSSGWVGLVGLMAALAVAGVTVSYSKGAVGVAFIGIALAAATLAPKRWRQRLRSFAAPITLTLIALVLITTIFRGAVLGESFRGDGYSLLFRWHYWQGAFRIFLDHPWLGVGPDGFKDAYLIVKPPESPEEVSTPHSVFITWLATLGIGGVGWIALTLILITRIAPHRERPEFDPASSAASPSRAAHMNNDEDDDERAFVLSFARPAATLALLSLVFGWWVNRASMGLELQVLLWPLSMAMFGGAMVVLPWIGHRTSWALLRWAVWAAATVAIVHCQIEMGLTQPASASLLMLLLGAAGASANAGMRGAPAASAPAAAGNAERIGRRRSNRILAATGGLICAGILLAYSIFAWLPVVREQMALKRAALSLALVGELRRDLMSIYSIEQLDDVLATLERMESRLIAAGVDPHIEGRLREARSVVRANDPARLRRIMTEIEEGLSDAIRQLDAARIAVALDRLQGASSLGWGAPAGDDDAEPRATAKSILDPSTVAPPGQPYVIPNDSTLFEEAAKLELALAAAAVDIAHPTEARTHIESALDWTAALIAHQPDTPGSSARASRFLERAYELIGDQNYRDAAISWAAIFAAREPYGVTGAWRLAGLLDSAGRSEEAAQWYERALALNENLRLDPLKGLTDEQRAAIEQRISELRAP